MYIVNNFFFDRLIPKIYSKRNEVMHICEEASNNINLKIKQVIEKINETKVNSKLCCENIIDLAQKSALEALYKERQEQKKIITYITLQHNENIKSISLGKKYEAQIDINNNVSNIRDFVLNEVIYNKK